MITFQPARLCKLLALLVLIVPVLHAAPPWWLAETEHFRIASNARKQEIQRGFETIWEARTALQTLFPALNRQTDEKLLLIIIGDANTRDDFSFRRGRSRKRVGGYFTQDDDGYYAIINDLGSEEQTRQTIVHEYVHHLMANDASAPLWLKEGMAELFSTTRAKKADQLVIGMPVTSNIYYLKYAGFMPFEQLFAANHSSAEYTSAEHSGTFYSQSWLLLHFLLFGENDIPFSQVSSFVDEATRTKQINEAFTKRHLGMDYETLLEVLKEHLYKGTFRSLKVNLDKEHQAPELQLQRATPEDVERLYARVTLDVLSAEDSESWVKNAYESQPESAETTTLYGDWLFKQNRFEEAVAAYEKSLALDHSLARSHLGYAKAFAYLKIGDNFYKPDSLSQADTLTCLTHLFKARELGADWNASVYEWIGAVWLSSEVHPQDKHMSVIEEGLAAFPTNMAIVRDLALYQARSGDIESAEATILKVLYSLDAAEKAILATLLANLDSIEKIY